MQCYSLFGWRCQLECKDVWSDALLLVVGSHWQKSTSTEEMAMPYVHSLVIIRVSLTHSTWRLRAICCIRLPCISKGVPSILAFTHCVSVAYLQFAIQIFTVWREWNRTCCPSPSTARPNHDSCCSYHTHTTPRTWYPATEYKPRCSSSRSHLTHLSRLDAVCLQPATRDRWPHSVAALRTVRCSTVRQGNQWFWDTEV